MTYNGRTWWWSEADEDYYTNNSTYSDWLHIENGCPICSRGGSEGQYMVRRPVTDRRLSLGSDSGYATNWEAYRVGHRTHNTELICLETAIVFGRNLLRGSMAFPRSRALQLQREYTKYHGYDTHNVTTTARILGISESYVLSIDSGSHRFYQVANYIYGNPGIYLVCYIREGTQYRNQRHFVTVDTRSVPFITYYNHQDGCFQFNGQDLLHERLPMDYTSIYVGSQGNSDSADIMVWYIW